MGTPQAPPTGTTRTFGNMLNQKPVTKVHLKKKKSPWIEMSKVKNAF